MNEARATRWQSALATLLVFTLAAGDFWRYLLGYGGWAVLALALAIGVVRELIIGRVAVHRLPVTLIAFVGVATLSVAWSAYRLETALGATALIATTAAAAFLATGFSREHAIAVIRRTIAVVLAASMAFELLVSVVIRSRILPLWVDYSHLERIPNAYYWSRDLLFEGGRIQGIVGNSNILGFIALAGIVLFGVRLMEDRASRAAAIAPLVLAVAVMALTRSSTALAATAVVAFVATCALLVRRTAGRQRLQVYAAGALVAAGAIVAVVVWWNEILSFLGKSPDLTYRFVIWETVAGIAVERPVAGWGWVGYWPPWRSPFAGLLEFDGVSYYQAHNAALDVFLQLGAIGLVVFAVLALTTGARAWISVMDASRARLPEALALLGIVAALGIQALTESRLLTEFGWFLLAYVAIANSALSPRRAQA